VDDLQTVSGRTDVVAEVERRAAEERLTKALTQLTNDLREVMELQLDGTSPEESARQLGITVKQVYGRLFRARQRLAETLDLQLPPSNRGRKPKTRTEQPSERNGST